MNLIFKFKKKILTKVNIYLKCVARIKKACYLSEDLNNNTMTTKDIKSTLSVFQELPRTDKFKRSLDILLQNHPEISISIARPFKCFTSQTGKKFKVKIKNLKTGNAKLICKTRLKSYSDENIFFAKGCTYMGCSLDYLLKDKGLLNSEIEDRHRYAHVEEEINSTYWGEIALQISRLIECNSIHLEPCHKCNGVGIIPEFFHVAEGLCFECLGTKHKLVIDDKMIKAA